MTTLDSQRKNKGIPGVHIITYILLAFNTLFAVCVVLYYCFYELGTVMFMVVWIGVIAAVITVPAALVLSVYAIFQHLYPRLRWVAPLWMLCIIGIRLSVLVLPSGSSRIPNDMIRYYHEHYSIIHELSTYAADSLILPDSTAIRISKNGEVKTLQAKTNKFISYSLHCGPYLTSDTVFATRPDQIEHVRSLMRQANMDQLTIYQPSHLLEIGFVRLGFGHYWWFEVPYYPYTEEDMYRQLSSNLVCPYLPSVCFKYYEGTLHHKDEHFPCKQNFLLHHGIDSTYIYQFFSQDENLRDTI